jgi:hypothetical protein
MSDVFISYSSKDRELATWIHDRLLANNITPFLAEISLPGGANWKPSILLALRQSQTVLFLATPNSCSSDAVKHEIGAALVLGKQFIPMLAGISPGELPTWVQDKQAVDIYDRIKSEQTFDRICQFIMSKRFVTGALLAALLVAAVVCLVIQK